MKGQTPPSKYRIHYSNLFWISLVHVGALAAIPFYNFANLMTVIVGVFLLAPLAINLGFHRLIAHRAFNAPRWFTRFVATFGAMMGGARPFTGRRHTVFTINSRTMTVTPMIPEKVSGMRMCCICLKPLKKKVVATTSKNTHPIF